MVCTWLGVRGLARRYGVHARREALQHLKEVLRVLHDIGKITYEIDAFAAPDVLLSQCLILRPEQFLETLRHVVRAELGVLVDAAARELADAEPRGESLVQVYLNLVVIEHALRASEVQRVQHLGDGGLTVGGHDADSITGGCKPCLLRSSSSTCMVSFSLSGPVSRSFTSTRLM